MRPTPGPRAGSKRGEETCVTHGQEISEANKEILWGQSGAFHPPSGGRCGDGRLSVRIYMDHWSGRRAPERSGPALALINWACFQSSCDAFILLAKP